MIVDERGTGALPCVAGEQIVESTTDCFFLERSWKCLIQHTIRICKIRIESELIFFVCVCVFEVRNKRYLRRLDMSSLARVSVILIRVHFTRLVIADI